MQYSEEVFAQKTPYLQWLKQQQAELYRQYGQQLNDGNWALGKQIHRLPFSSCLDSVKDIGKISRGGVCLFVKDGGSLSEYAQVMMSEVFLHDSDAVLVYADEDYAGSLKELYNIDGRGDRDEVYRGEPWFKPDFSPDTLASFFYIGSVFAIRGDVVLEAAGAHGDKISIYELVYYIFMDELANRRKGIVHIPKVLYTNDCLAEKDSIVISDKVKKLYGPALAKDMVSIVIPSKDNAVVLQKCLKTVTKYTEYDNYEIIVVDNGSSPGQKMCITDVIDALCKEKEGLTIKYLYKKMDFNFSAMCNMGAESADGEYLLFLNDDIEVLDTREGAKWLRHMMKYAQKSHVGAVGAKLYYPPVHDDDRCYRIQHAGITNMGIGPAHKLGGMLDEGCLYHGHNTQNYDMLAVTAACMLVRRSLFDETGGFDPSFPVAYNDVAFCFALYQKGYFNVQVNDAVLIHHESLSRGQDTAPEKAERLSREKHKLYDKYPSLKGRDPFYSPNLVQWKKDAGYSTGYLYECDKVAQPRLLYVRETDKVFQRYDFREKIYKKNIAAAKIYDRLTGYYLLMTVIDNIEEDDKIVTINGWCVQRKRDNARILKKIWLINDERNTDCRTVYAFDIQPKLREDVAALFEDGAHHTTKNTALSGMQLRFEKDRLAQGNYRIGILVNEKRLLFVEDANGNPVQYIRKGVMEHGK